MGRGVDGVVTVATFGRAVAVLANSTADTRELWPVLVGVHGTARVPNIVVRSSIVDLVLSFFFVVVVV